MGAPSAGCIPSGLGGGGSGRAAGRIPVAAVLCSEGGGQLGPIGGVPARRIELLRNEFLLVLLGLCLWPAEPGSAQVCAFENRAGKQSVPEVGMAQQGTASSLSRLPGLRDPTPVFWRIGVSRRPEQGAVVERFPSRRASRAAPILESGEQRGRRRLPVGAACAGAEGAVSRRG